MRCSTVVASIDLSALTYNLNQIKKITSSKIMAVVKANAYGHQLGNIVNAFLAADGLAVARIEEAVELRKLGWEKTILVLEGFANHVQLDLASQHQLDVVVHHVNQTQVLIEQDKKTNHNQLVVWLKANTGMNRLGLPHTEIESAYCQLKTLQLVQNIKLMSHLATAEKGCEYPQNIEQIGLFNQLLPQQKIERSLANSAALLTMPDTHLDWVRPGILLCGVSPLVDKTGKDLALKPAMTLETKLIAINRVEKGQAIGYGGTFIANRTMRVGVAAVGYGDGYSRHFKSGTPVIINEQYAKLVGLVSMDMITIDLSEIDDVNIGDKVTLWGEKLPVEQVATWANSIPYELLTGLTQRVEMNVHGE